MYDDARRYETGVDISGTPLILLAGRNKRVLEIGPATGYITKVLRERGCRVSAIEIDPAAAEIAAAFCERIIVGDVEDIDFEQTFGGERFDVVMLGDVLEHLVDPRRILEKLRVLLAPGGYVVASIPNVGHASVRVMLLDGRFGYTAKGVLDHTHLRFFTRSGIQALFDGAGYSIRVWRRILTDTVDDPFAEGLSLSESELPPHLTEALRQDPEALTYQYVIRAYPRPPSKPSRRRAEAATNGAGRVLDAFWRLEERFAEKDGQIAELQTALRDAGEHQTGLEASLSETEAELREVRQAYQATVNSVGYRLLERIRRLVNRTLPRRTRRRALFIAFARGGDMVLSRGWGTFLRRLLQVWRWMPRILALARPAHLGASLNDQYQLWLQAHALTPARTRAIRSEAAGFSYRPKVSIIMPVYNTDPAWLREAIESVRTQLYDNWELCIGDDGSTKTALPALLENYARAEERIKVAHLEENQGISAASEQALALATGEYVGFLDHDDELKPDALYEVVKLLNERPELDFIYSDEDKRAPNGRLVEPFFKPDWSPDLLLSTNYVTHFAVYRKRIVDEVGGLRSRCDFSQDYDLALRVTERTERIGHIPRPLYTWRMIPGSAASEIEAKPRAAEAAKRALADAMQRRGIQAQVTDGLWSGAYRISYRILGEPLVSIIVPTKDQVRLLARCIDSIRRKTAYQNYEIVVVDNGSSEESTHKYLKGQAQQGGIRVLEYPHPFNFSTINNFAARHARGEHLLFLNNDTEAIREEWLSAMLEHSQRPEVGAVGARLLYADGRLQHGGVIVGLGGVAGHAHKLLPKGEGGYFARAKVIQNFSAVTAACLMIRAEVFADLGGFDEEHLPIAFGDVDLCLRIRERGLLVVWTPYAELYHHESVSRGSEDTPEKQRRFAGEIAYMKAKWGDSLLNDPYYSPNLSLDTEHFNLRV